MILHAQDLSKAYHHKSHSTGVDVLNQLSLEVTVAETVAILGQSGSGKSTLLSLLAGLDVPSSGHVIVQGTTLDQLSEADLARFRAQHIGIIFQQFHLMSHLTAVENIALPLEILGKEQVQKEALEVLGQVGLSHRADHFPHQLSGGECQRVAIARALITKPAIILADEPTGNLDVKTGLQVQEFLFDIVAEHQATLLLVTHNEVLAQQCGRQLVLQGGQLESVG